MIHPLNYTPKVIEAFERYQAPAAPLSRIMFGYLAAKLRQAQVFLLPDHGELLERDKPRPEMAGLVFKPPYPVTVLEYAAPPGRAMTPGMDLPCPKRVVLAWEWTDDAPPELRGWIPPDLGPGVVVASIVYTGNSGTWIPVAAAAHFAYDDVWVPASGLAVGPLRQAMIDTHRVKPSILAANTYHTRPFALLPEALLGMWQAAGQDGSTDMLAADLMDELNAYADFSFALACRNVTVESHPAPSRLNAARTRAGKIPLFDHHVLKLSGEDGRRGPAVGVGEGSSPRPHLRRGHIRHLRHLGPDRITWVNAAMVRGRSADAGFADKDYAVGARS
jgi:hypothetical protein